MIRQQRLWSIGSSILTLGLSATHEALSRDRERHVHSLYYTRQWVSSQGPTSAVVMLGIAFRGLILSAQSYEKGDVQLQHNCTCLKGAMAQISSV